MSHTAPKTLSDYRKDIDSALEDSFLRRTLDTFAVAYRANREAVFKEVDERGLIKQIADAKDDACKHMEELYEQFRRVAEERGAGKTGLSSKAAFVIILGIFLDHLVVIIPVALLIHLVGLRTGIIGCSGNLLEGRMLQGRLRDQCHISRTGIMLFVLKSMRIRKMRVDTAKLRCFRIHQIRKATDTAADCFRNTVCNIVCRFQHQSVERPAHA